MTNDEMRIAIAEHLGWCKVKTFQWSEDGNTRLPKQYINARDLPNYPEDLNAMHEAEKVFDDGKGEDSMRFRYSYFIYNETVPKDMQPFRATARQRAEAFLRAVGKWIEKGKE